MVALNVLGLNCGTSIDGIDVAHCRISSVEGSNDVRIELLGSAEVPVDPALRSQVLHLCRPTQEGAATSMAEICDLNFALGREFSRAIALSGVCLENVDLIASHGQTLWHQPLGENRSTLQMAEPAVIAQKTQKTVVSGFRVAELAAGRQGAPLAGFFEAALLSDPHITRISQNIGGIGNATVLPASGNHRGEKAASSYLAFDTGPGNVFIDAAMRILTDGAKHYDCDGELGALGEPDIDGGIVSHYLDNEPYFQQSPPKTTGRELFSDDVALSIVKEMESAGKSHQAIIATITRITAESIARAYESFVLPYLGDDGNIDEIYICGGGAYNPNILRHLQARFPKSRVMTLDDAPVKLDPSAKEAVLFALLGFLGVCGRTVQIAADSESMEPAVMGVVTPGSNYCDVLRAVGGGGRKTRSPTQNSAAQLQRIDF
ncbi:Anhydro-N-acetylmuramic acid kinase [Dactylonectria macrodidyma]|uniref:Anhydro-N-acetylmuramic acid kinase n=1 Tax=Dactylonectria macrodidyma TaxID=307937 RepID=A0A9P9IIL3_9HYPO|nr:Anhydro-N-acetylmuramic acid kinase [Dactylonectria macrodidyma]